MNAKRDKKRVFAHWKVDVGSINYYNDGTYELKDHNNEEVDISQWSDREISDFLTKANVLIFKNDNCPLMKKED